MVDFELPFTYNNVIIFRSIKVQSVISESLVNLWHHEVIL